MCDGCESTSEIMDGGPPSPCVPSICRLANHQSRGSDPAPQYVELLEGTRQGGSTSMLGPVTGVVRVWFPSCMDEQRNESIHNCTRRHCQGVLRISHDLRRSDRQTDRQTVPHRQQNRHFAPLVAEVINRDSDPRQQSLSLELRSHHNVQPVSIRRNDPFQQSLHRSQRGQWLWGWMQSDWGEESDEQRSGDILSLCNYEAVFVQSCNWSLAAASNV